MRKVVAILFIIRIYAYALLFHYFYLGAKCRRDYRFISRNIDIYTRRQHKNSCEFKRI